MLYQIRMLLPGITSHGRRPLSKWASPSLNARVLLPRTAGSQHGVLVLSRVSAIIFKMTHTREESDRGSARNPTPLPLRTRPPPTVESTPGITLPGPGIPVQARATIPPSTSVPGITPPDVAIPAQADAFAPPPTCAPGIVPPGPAFPTLLQALAFYAAAPPSEFTTST